MNILFLSTWYPYPPNNGSKLRAYYLIRALSRSHQVTVVAYQPESRDNKTLSKSQVYDAVPVWGAPEDPFRHVELPQIAKYLSPIPLSAWPSTVMRRTVSTAASRQHWDAVVAFQWPAARYALMPHSTTRIFDADSFLSFMTSKRVAAESNALTRLKARISGYKSFRFEYNLARQFHACTVVSPLEIDFIRHMVKGTSCRVEVNGNGVDCDHNQPGLNEPRPGVLVYNGSLTYSANYDAMRWFLAQIYPVIKTKLPGVSLTITGSTKGVDTVGLALDDSVRLTGFVDDVRIPVAEAAICVVPIRQGRGTRLKILEAMALGTPVVSTSKGAEGLEVVTGEHLLIADDPLDFANNVTRLLGDDALRKRLSAKARKLVEERYDWQQIGERFVQLVEQSAAIKQHQHENIPK